MLDTFTIPIGHFALIVVAVLVALITGAFVIQFLRKGRPLHTYFGRPTPPPFKPPGQWDPEEVERRQREIHPRWMPPEYPGQCPICRAMPGERCDAGLHC